MSLTPSNRGQSIPSSATLAINAKASALRESGVDIINFAAGQPDFGTPAHIIEAGQRALAEGHTRYTPTEGVKPLREAIAAEIGRVTGAAYGPDNVVVTAGAKQAIYNLIQVLTDPGDQVLFATPYWVSYVPMAIAAGAEPVVLPTRPEEGYLLQPDVLREQLSERSRVLILNSPANPTGAAYATEDLERLAEVALAHPDVTIISDEIYRLLVYDGFTHVSIAALSPEAAARTIIVDGTSKTYAMTGWRIGYAVGDAAIIGAATSLQSHSTSCAAAVSQQAALAALTGSQDCIAEMAAKFTARRKVLLDRVAEIDGFAVVAPRGAFYAFIDYRGAVGGDPEPDDVATCNYLLDRAHAACVPGSAFGAPGHLRLSFATSEQQILTGLGRIAEALPGLGEALRAGT